MCLAQVGVSEGGRKLQQLKGAPAQPAGVPAGVACDAYPYKLTPGASAEVAVKAVYTGVLQLHPAEITQAAPQRVLLRAGLYVASPYRVAKQTTKLDLGSGTKVERYTKQPEPVSRKGGKVTYGPYADVAPFSQAELAGACILCRAVGFCWRWCWRADV